MGGPTQVTGPMQTMSPYNMAILDTPLDYQDHSQMIQSPNASGLPTMANTSGIMSPNTNNNNNA